MAQPTIPQVHVDRPLTNISTAYIQSETDFIADSVAPTIPVAKPSDLYYEYAQEDFMSDNGVTVRVDGQESSGSGYRLSTDSYLCRVYAFHKDVGPQMLASADAPLNPARSATTFVTRRMLIRRERIWTNTWFIPGVWANDYTGQAAAPAVLPNFVQWDNFADSDPRADIRVARQAIKSNTGFTPNTLVLADNVAEVLKAHPDLAELFKYTTGGLLDTSRLAQVFNVARVIIGGAVVATSPEQVNPNAAATYNFLQGNHAWLGYVNMSPSLMEPSAGYTFAWTGLLGAGAYANRILRIPTPLLGDGSYRVEGEMAFDIKIVGPSLGAFFEDAVS